MQKVCFGQLLETLPLWTQLIWQVLRHSPPHLHIVIYYCEILCDIHPEGGSVADLNSGFQSAT
jgi:hypothetical protein